VAREVAKRAGDLRGLLRRHPTQARQVVRLILGLGVRLMAEPFDDARGKGYRFAVTGSYARLGVRGLDSVTVGKAGTAG
jgi:hypothetical protein